MILCYNKNNYNAGSFYVLSKSVYSRFRNKIFRIRRIIMDIAALSMAMAQVNTQSAYGVAMLSKSLDLASSTGDQIVGMMDAAAMELSVNPHIGANIDISV